MCHAREFLQIHRRVNPDIAEWVEVLDRHVEFFGKKLRRVRHNGRAACQKKSLRGCPAHLATVKLHRLVDLNVQFRHELPGDFGNSRLIWTLWFLIRATKADEPLA